jgi:urease accessory protein
VADLGWQGSAKLVFAECDSTTQPLISQAQAPLKVQRSFYPEGPEVCHTTLLHTAGGMVGGDRLSVDIYAQANAKVLLTTAAASKIYGSYGQSQLFPQGQLAQQQIVIKLDPGSYLEWLPQAAIVFDGAVYRQDLRVELAPGASWLGWEITRFGRTARGERFLTGEWRSQTEVWQQGRPLWIDRQFLSGVAMLDSPHGLAGQPVIASLVWLGQSAEPGLIDQIRRLAGQGEVGVTGLELGLLCRYRGASSQAALSWLIQVWRVLRQYYWQRSVVLPRVWPL